MSFLQIDDRGPVRWITLDNPGAKNAVPRPGWLELEQAFLAFESSTQRTLVLIGSEGNFCSGATLDTDEMDVLRNVATNRSFMDPVGRAAMALFRLSKPTIAAVDGVAVGAGMNMALLCDLVVATERARFSEIFVNRGLTMDFGGTWLLPRMIGRHRAAELALTGSILSVGEAVEFGLVSRVVAVADLVQDVTDLAETLANKPPHAVRTIKQLLSRSGDLTFEQAIAAEAQAQATLLASDDFHEGVAAFLEKRDPVWSNMAAGDAEPDAAVPVTTSPIPLASDVPLAGAAEAAGAVTIDPDSFRARFIDGTLIVAGHATVDGKGSATIRRAIPQGFDPSTLLLDVVWSDEVADAATHEVRFVEDGNAPQIVTVRTIDGPALDVRVEKR